MPSQLAKGGVQAISVHTPSTQPATPLGNEQTLPHAPQLLTSPVVLISQPLAGSRSQSAKPALQVKPHTPAAQVGCALAGVGQTVPQAPQLRMVFRSVQTPLQQPWPGAHISPHPAQFPGVPSSTQAPSQQDWPPLQTVVQVPQWDGSLETLMQKPPQQS